MPSTSPTGFTVVSMSSSSVILTWDELPCPDQNGPLLDYVIQYTPDGGTPSTAMLPLLMENNQLTELTAFTRYMLRIAAQNDAGMSDFSLPVSVVTSGNGKL